MGCSGLVGEKLSPVLSATSWEPAASLCLPSQSVSPASLPIPVPSDRLWSSRWEVGQRSSKWSGRFAGRTLWIAPSTEAGKGEGEAGERV